jgi:hypothetical protein
MGAVEDAEGWTFAFAENLVTQLRVDYRFTVVLENGVEIVIDRGRPPRGEPDAGAVGEGPDGRRASARCPAPSDVSGSS